MGIYYLINSKSIIVINRAKRISINKEQSDKIVAFTKDFLSKSNNALYSPGFFSDMRNEAKEKDTYILVKKPFTTYVKFLNGKDIDVKKTEISLEHNILSIHHSDKKQTVYGISSDDKQKLMDIIDI